MNLDELIRASVRDVAAHAPVSAPDVPEIERRGRRTRRGQVFSAVVAVVALAAAGGMLGQELLGGTDVSPADPDPSPGVDETDIVWSDGRALHFGAETVSAKGRVFGIGRVSSGLVYTAMAAETKDDAVYLQPADGSTAELIGRRPVLAPSGDPSSGIAAWVEQDGSLTELVVYDTRAGQEVGRTSVPRVLGPDDNILIPGFGPILAIDADEVYFSGGHKEVWVYAWGSGDPARATRYRTDRWLDTAADVTATTTSTGTVSFRHPNGLRVTSRRFEQGLLSPDGETFVGTTAPTSTKPGGLFLVDTATGQSRRLNTGLDTAPLFGAVFASDDTIVLKGMDSDSSSPDAMTGRIIACDVGSQSCTTVASVKNSFFATVPSR